MGIVSPVDQNTGTPRFCPCKVNTELHPSLMGVSSVLKLGPFLALTGVGTGKGPVLIRLVLDFHDHLDLYAGTVGQRGHAHSGPGMGSGLTVQLAQKLGCSVGNLGLLAEIRG